MAHRLPRSSGLPVRMGQSVEQPGREFGDAVLVEVARRLQPGLRPYDTIARPADARARLGADEFAPRCKNEEFILQAGAAMPRATRDRGDVRVVFSGDGPELSDNRTAAARDLQEASAGGELRVPRSLRRSVSAPGSRRAGLRA